MEVSRDEALDLGKKGRLAALSERDRAQQIQARHHRKHSARRENLALSQRRLHRSLRRPARHAHGKHRRVQAHERGKRVLQGRRKESAAAARLRHGVQNEKGTRRLLRDARGSEEARSSQARQANWSFSFSTTMSAPVFRCFCRAAQ